MRKRFTSILIPAVMGVLALAGARNASASPSLCDTVTGNIVFNCGFETGDFTDWSVTGNLYGGVGGNYIGVDDTNPNSGDFEAYFGAPSEYGQTGMGDTYGPPTTLSQSLTVNPFHYYSLDFYLATGGCSVADGCPGYYNHFDAAMNDVTVFSQDNVPTTNGTYDEYTFLFANEQNISSLPVQFNFTNDSDYFYLDDVTVTDLGTIPEPATFGFMALGLGLVYGVSRRARKSRG